MKKRKLSLEEKSYTLSDKIMLRVSTLILALFFLAIMYPLIYAVISSFSKGVLDLNLIPDQFTLEGYRHVLTIRFCGPALPIPSSIPDLVRSLP